MSAGPAAGDSRLTPARPDLAAASLRGLVEAARFVEGERRRVVAEVADLKRRPRHDAPVDTQLLHGETVRVFEEEEGWAWLQAEGDGYVGYLPESALGPAEPPATHRVVVNRTFVYPAPDMKQPVAAALPLDARVAPVGTDGLYVRLWDGGFVFGAHLAPLGQPAPDFVAVAEQLSGAPYLWGGKSAGGIDCSGLVQLASAVAGRALPRDTDLQERDAALEPVDAGALRRGDLVFWKGHVGVMRDAERLLHANGYHMLVMTEPLENAKERIARTSGLSIAGIRRFLP